MNETIDPLEKSREKTREDIKFLERELDEVNQDIQIGEEYNAYAVWKESRQKPTQVGDIKDAEVIDEQINI